MSLCCLDIRQSMRLIHNIPFTSAEREIYRRLVFMNIANGIRSLLEAMEEWGEPLGTPENAVSLRPWRAAAADSVQVSI